MKLKVGDKLYCYKNIFNGHSELIFSKGKFYEILRINDLEPQLTNSYILINNNRQEYNIGIGSRHDKMSLNYFFYVDEHFYDVKSMRKLKLDKISK